jgi:hypothetical protein
MPNVLTKSSSSSITGGCLASAPISLAPAQKVNEEGSLDDGETAHANEERKASAGQNERLGEIVHWFALVNHLRLNELPRDTRVVKPEHRCRRLE